MNRAIAIMAVFASCAVVRTLHGQQTNRPEAVADKERTTVTTTESEPREVRRPSAGLRNSAAAILQKRVESVDWTDTTFEEVIDWLVGLGEGEVNVLPRWRSLEAEGVDREFLITLQMKNVRAGEVLDEVMSQLSDSGAVTFRAQDNVLRISSRKDFERKLLLKVYDCTDILFRVPNNGKTAPSIDLTQVSQQGGGGAGGGGGGGRGVFSSGGGGQQDQEESGQQAEQELEERLTALRELIEQTVEPASWDKAPGGGLGHIRVFNQSLIVVNTVEVHEQVAGFVELHR